MNDLQNIFSLLSKYDITVSINRSITIQQAIIFTFEKGDFITIYFLEYGNFQDGVINEIIKDMFYKAFHSLGVM